jgi:hypothetical protein
MAPDLEALIVALHVEFSLRTGHFSQSPWVLETWQMTVPEGVILGQDLWRSGQLQQWCAEGASIAQVMIWLTSQNVTDPEREAVQRSQHYPRDCSR